MDPDEYDYLFKIVLLGDTNVGKTQLFNQFVMNKFQENSQATIGVEFKNKTLLIDGKYFKVIFDVFFKLNVSD